jgi:hypothetical protein
MMQVYLPSCCTPAIAEFRSKHTPAAEQDFTVFLGAMLGPCVMLAYQ